MSSLHAGQQLAFPTPVRARREQKGTGRAPRWVLPHFRRTCCRMRRNWGTLSFSRESGFCVHIAHPEPSKLGCHSNMQYLQQHACPRDMQYMQQQYAVLGTPVSTLVKTRGSSRAMRLEHGQTQDTAPLAPVLATQATKTAAERREAPPRHHAGGVVCWQARLPAGSTAATLHPCAYR